MSNSTIEPCEISPASLANVIGGNTVSDIFGTVVDAATNTYDAISGGNSGRVVDSARAGIQQLDGYNLSGWQRALATPGAAVIGIAGRDIGSLSTEPKHG